MNSCSIIKNPLNHNGTSQVERLLHTLIPDNFKIDASTIQDLISATNEYALLLQYYDENNKVDGDWSCFWEIEPLTFLAIVSGIDTGHISRGYEKLRKNYINLPDEQQDEAAEAKYALKLIEYIKDQAKKIEHFYRLLPVEIPLKNEILALIRRDGLTDREQLADALGTLIGYHKEAYAKTLETPQDLNHSQYEFFFHSHWAVKDASDFYQIPFSTAYKSKGFEKLNDLFKKFHKALVKIKNRANFWFEQNMKQPQVKEPHVALFLAFLRLFEYARQDLNSLTRKHLEYYYLKVLHFKSAPAVPDNVHLIFELANNVDQYLVKKGTELLAGKDKNNRPLIFTTKEDWVIGKAKVSSLKNSYIDYGLGNIFVNPDVSQKYCKQEALANQQAVSWRPMGDDKELPYGEIGFAIASPQLILQEGKRTLNAYFKLSEGIPFVSNYHFNVQLSSGKEWIQLAKPPVDDKIDEKGLPGTSYKIIVDQIEMQIGPLEAVRRLVVDLVADTGQLVAENNTNSEIQSIYNRNKEDSLELLNKYIYQNAYACIKETNYLIPEYSNPGKLYFIRAYLYWSLASVFAPPYDKEENETNGNLEEDTDLPKILDPNEEDEKKAFNVGGLYEQIVEDLQTAKSLLSENNEKPGINSYAASAFLSRVYLQMHMYQNAIEECKKIIDSGQFKLGENPIDIFEFTDSHPEAIWWYDVKNDETEDVFALYNWLNQQGKVSAKKNIAVSNSFLEEVGWNESTEDKRFKQLFEKDDDNQVWVNKYYRNELDGYHRIVIIRYAEVLLNTAIGNAKLGKNDDGYDHINKIRRRVDLDSIENKIQEELIDFITIERWKELAFEGDRRNFLQMIKQSVPNGDRESLDSESVEWNDKSLHFTPPDYNSIDFSSEPTLYFREIQITTDLKADFPPVMAMEDPIKEGNLNTQWPVLKFTLNASSNISASQIERLLNTSLTQVDLNVEVTDLKENLVVHSDVGVFDGQQEFLPFSAVPKRGNLFRLGSAEAMRKNLDSMKIRFSWIDPPDFDDYGNNYVKIQNPTNENNGDDAENTNGTDENKIEFVRPSLKLDFLNGASQVPRKSGNTDHLDNSIDFGEIFSIIKGIITDPTGHPIENVRVYVDSSNNNGAVHLANLKNKPSDTFTNISNKEGKFLLDDISSNYIEFIYNNHSDIPNPPTYNVVSYEVLAISDQKIKISVVLQPYYLLNMINGDSINQVFTLQKPHLPRYGKSLNFERYESTFPQGFIQLEMVNGDFLHEAYPTALTIQTIALSKVEARDDVLDNATLPHPPYTPATNGISLDYYSYQPIPVGPENDGIDQFYHIMPFQGYKEVKINDAAKRSVPLFYSYPAHDRESPDFAPGNLFIELEDLQPGSNLSLLIQTREGSAEEPDWQAPAIRWSYLAENNQWLPFTAEQILKDTTYGLTRTGVVQLMLPFNITKSTTLFQGKNFWLRVAAIENFSAEPPRSVHALPRIVNIFAQALTAQFENNKNDLSHLAEPLPAGNVNKLLQSNSLIKKIKQPFPSFNGRLPEKGNAFYRRVSERLRHKDRAVTLWDYERLVLQQFPEIYRAKCLNHSHLTLELAPGHVLIAVVPDLQQRQDEFPVEPRFSKGDLKEMEQYLRQKTNLFVAHTTEDNFGNTETQYLRVANPLYESVKIKFDVRFIPGVDVNFHTFVLDDELKHFLSPWLKDKAADIRFNQSLHRSRIVQFIEERKYVDVVLNLEVEHTGIPVPSWQSFIVPSTTRSILTTFVAESKDPEQTDHEIRTFTKSDPVPC